MYTKKTKIKKASKRVPEFHYFDYGTSEFRKQSIATAKEAFSGSNLGGSIGAITSGVTDVIKAGLDNAKIADTSEQHAEREARMSEQSTATDNASLLAEMADDVAIGHTGFWDVRGSSRGQQIGNTFKGMASGAAAGAKVGGPWGAVAGAAVGLASGVAGIFAGDAKARKEQSELNKAALKANQAKAATFANKAGGLDAASDARAAAVFAAEGGEINLPKFSYFDDGITEFNTGGTHEENPHGGIPQGIAPDGFPNLVEEGEVKFDNYIFSDRLMLNKNDKKKYKFLKGKTYADAAKTIKRELGIDERPNDLIAKTDLEEHLNLLSTLQEEERVRKGLKGENKMMYKNGGHMFKGTTNQWYFSSDGNKWEMAGEDLSRKDILSKMTTGQMGYGHLDQEGNLEGTTYDKVNTKKQARKNYRDAISKNTTTPNYLSMAPVVGNALGVLTQTFNRPDYKHAKELQQSNEKFTPISYTPLTQKMEYKPFDVDYYGNKLGAQAGATRRAIREQTASNPYASTAALLIADANAQRQMGDLYRQAEEYNLGQREKVNTFNRATDSANAEMAMKTAQLNNSLKDRMYSRQLERDSMAARLKMAEDQAWSQSMSTSLTGMFDNLGDIAKQDMAKEMANDYILGQIRANGFDLIDGKLVSAGKAHGGKITTRNIRKNKKGFTV